MHEHTGDSPGDPEFKPTPEQVAAIQTEFGLSYHVEYTGVGAELVGFAGKRVLEVGGSLPPAFVFRHLKVAQWTAVEELSYWRTVEQGGHRKYAPLAQAYTKHLSDATADDIVRNPYLLLDGAVEQVPPALDGQFDLVFSIACFEHLSRLPKALAAMARVLKPGGKLFTMFSPIWSAFDGHHLPTVTDAAGRTFVFNRNCPIPPWGHLMMGPSLMYEYLLGKTDAVAAEEMVYFVYHAPNINRLFTEDYLRYFARTGLRTVHCVETFKSPVPPATQAQLERHHPGYSRFANNGFLLVQQRSG